MSWCNPPTTKAKQRAFLTVIADRIERDAPHLIAHVAALRALERHMYNRKPAHICRKQSVPMSPAVKRQIRLWRAVDPDLPQHVIGTRVGVNQGRVNNTLRGVRI
jgi:hypothetical protein